MKRKFSLFIACILIISTMCGSLTAFADTESKEDSKYLDDKTYYHLDMGVTVVTGNDGKWKGDKYGDTVPLPNPIPITFGNPIEITGYHAFDINGIANGTEPFTFQQSKGDSWNIPIDKTGKGDASKILKKRKEHYEDLFLPYTTKATKISVEIKEQKGNETVVNLDYTRKIASNTKLNIAEEYRQNPNKARTLAYQGWGNRAGLVAQASYDEGAKKILEGLDEIFANKHLNDGYELDMVFVPIVIEYKILKPEETTCTRCGKCLVHGDTVCTEESCENYGTEECGCYEAPVITSDFSVNGTCVASKTWTTHNHSHSYCSSYSCGKDGDKCCRKYCYYDVTHTVTLELSNVKLTADKPMKSHKGNEVTFKSGYGFYITGNAKTTYTHISTCPHGKNPSDGSYTQPSKAYLSTNWTVKGSDKKKKYTQGKTVELGMSGGNITTLANPISNYGKKLIYTDVELKGTKKNPVKHTVTLYVKGATVTAEGKTQELCASIPLTFWIKGNMYEDDYTVEAR